MTGASGLLEAVTAAACRAAAERARGAGARAIEREAADRVPRGDLFRASLTRPGVRVIAECKRRSPSRGVLRRDYDPAAIAAGYATAGAAAVSVLTEPAFFDGDLGHLRAVRAAVTLPLLRKDFVVSEFQIIESRAAGADAILLIVAAVGAKDLVRFRQLAADSGLAVLVEAHDVREVKTAVDAGADLIGINSRDLRTLNMVPSVFEELASHLPASAIRVAESGLRSADELCRLRALGYQACLVGERLMIAPDPGAALGALLAAAGRDRRWA